MRLRDRLWNLGVVRTLRLVRSDGVVYLNRIGIGHRRLGGIYLHRFEGPDPGIDTHDHPWWFASFVLRGGYDEVVQTVGESNGVRYARPRRSYRTWRAGSIHKVGLDKSHQIVRLLRIPTWTLVIRGPVVRQWGFFEKHDGPELWVHHRESDPTRRDLVALVKGGET